MTLDIAKKLNVPLETAHQFKVLNGLNTGPRQEKITEALKPSLQRIIGEIQKVIRYYTDRFPDESRLEQVLIVGSGSSVPGLGEYFTGELTCDQEKNMMGMKRGQNLCVYVDSYCAKDGVGIYVDIEDRKSVV